MKKLAKQALALISFALSVTCLPQSSPAADFGTSHAACDGAGQALTVALVPAKKIRERPHKLEIYQFDDSPVGRRRPLLLVHGLLGEFHPFFRWQELCQYLTADETFRSRYKIYLARYNSYLPLKEIKTEFGQSIRRLAPNGGLTIVAISLSAAIVRDAMADPKVDECVDRVLTMGAFFRGSPLFCSDWMHETINKRHLSPLCRFDRSFGYKLYFGRHKNLQRDYFWDNVDGQMPETVLLPDKKDVHIQESAVVPPVAAQAVPLAADHKFIVYAGYLHNQYMPEDHGPVHDFVVSPYTFVSTTLPAQLGNEHAALRFLNCLIAGAVPRKAKSNDVIYPFNDGISPVYSSLLLPDNFVATTPLRSEADLKKLRGQSYAKKARLFQATDHLTFIEGPKPLGNGSDVEDVLSLSEKPRPMFYWILQDILE